MLSTSLWGQDTTSVRIIQQAAGKIIQLRDSVTYLGLIANEQSLLANKYKIIIARDSAQIGLLTKQSDAYNNIIAKYQSMEKTKWYDTKTMRFAQGFLFAVATIFVATKI